MQNIVYFFRKEFNKLVKIIYVDPEESFMTLEDGSKINVEAISFHIDMLFYLIMSQYFKKIKIKFGGELKDLRTHLFLILPSRMGKGQLIKVCEEVGNNIGLNIKRISYLNQASLIGSLNEHAIKYNMDKNLTQDNPKFKDPIMYGALATADIIIFPEAKKLIKGMNESETEFILSTLQEALDYPGIINKELKFTEYPIQYESTTSILATTYYLAEISELFMNQGFFQRIATYKKDYSLDEIKKLRSLIIEKYRETSTKLNFNESALKFSKIIKGINNNERIITFSTDSIKMLHKFNISFFNKLEKLSGKQVEILKSFSQTIIEICVKIAGINCCIRQDHTIIKSDLVPALEIFHPFCETIINQLSVVESKHDTSEQLKKLIINNYKKYVNYYKKYPNKTELRDYCQGKGIGSNKAYTIINRMILENYFMPDKKELILTENN